MKVRSKAMYAATAVAFLLIPLSTRAASGTVDILITALSTPSVVQMGDTTVTARGGNGTLTFIRSSGEPFTEGTSAAVQFASFSKKTASGFELEADGVATFGSGDILNLLFIRKTGDLAPGTSGEGVLQMAGGNGRFAGVKGKCSYKVENLAGNWGVTIAKCQWSN
jgi:hypothetical protein